MITSPKIKKSTAPPLKFLLRHPAHLIACGFGSGLSPFAPGTAGTAFAWLTYPLLRGYLESDLSFGIFLVLAFILGVAACQITGRALGVVDHGSIVWDEIVPFWTVLLFAPIGFFWQIAAFLGFRFYDIVKPQPAKYFDTRVKNGFGVMMDDLVAAGYTILTLALIKSALDAYGPYVGL
ncbi:MAG TPA: phosphatidylglycerophosphatase A [Rhodocyclaceae bacterium]|nr:phosphatidylglycerophosphatase A [Rhodocyclaceae bacterium]